MPASRSGRGRPATDQGFARFDFADDFDYPAGVAMITYANASRAKRPTWSSSMRFDATLGVEWASKRPRLTGSFRAVSAAPRTRPAADQMVDHSGPHPTAVTTQTGPSRRWTSRSRFPPVDLIGPALFSPGGHSAHALHHLADVRAEGFGRSQIARDHFVDRGIRGRNHNQAEIAAEIVDILAR
jgi:hypothetical protein